MGKLTRQGKADVIFDIVNTFLLTVVLIAALYPLLYVVSTSLSDPVDVIAGRVWLLPENFTLDAYVRVFKNQDILMGYKNTIIYTVVGTTFNVFITIIGAYPLSRKDFYGRKLLMALTTFTMFFHAGLIPHYLLIKSLGLVNSFWVMIIPGAVSVWNLIIMRTFFQNTIPSELYESASLDGCSNIRVLMSIVIPLSGPIIAIMVLFYGVNHWNEFFSALIYLSDRNKYPLQLVLREILIQSKFSEMVDTSSESYVKQQLLTETLKYAVIIVASLPILMLYPFIQKYFVKGVMVGAIKG